jgi:hypothetical protein
MKKHKHKHKKDITKEIGEVIREAKQEEKTFVPRPNEEEPYEPPFRESEFNHEMKGLFWRQKIINGLVVVLVIIGFILLVISFLYN